MSMVVNTDASVSNRTGGAGMILKHHEGAIIFGSCRHIITCDDILEAEILALEEGISIALQWSNLHIDIESDCLEAVSMVKSTESNLSKYAFFIVWGNVILALLILVV